MHSAHDDEPCLMTKTSPPVTRVVGILNFLAGHADQAFTATEISKSLKISNATCHNLLGALTQSGYVFRTAGKTYVLGPALANVAQASLTPELVMNVARPEMRLLADEFDVVCSAFSLKNNDIVILERAAAVSHISWNAPQVPPPVPAVPPLGGLFFAWTEGSPEQWLNSADPPLDADTKTKLLDSLSFMRVRGYSFGIRRVPVPDLDRALELKFQQALTDYALSDIESRQSYQLAYVAAPIFSKPGVIAFGLGLSGFISPIKGDRVETIGEKLRAACDRIGKFIAGRDFHKP
jgi:DNA-binding IclR family transcriptional regulator